MVTGLKPREFVWVIKDRLAVSERIGGYGFQHRRVRREEEIVWLNEAGVNAVLSLLEGNQNLANYEEAGFKTYHEPLLEEVEDADIERVFEALDGALENPDAVVLVHRDLVDDTVAGMLAGYLVHCGLVEDPIVATAAIQEIVGRPLGPEGRGMIPEHQVD